MRDRPLMLDGEIRNAAPRIEAVRLRKRRGRADVETGTACAATVRLRRIGRQIERGENRAEEQPRAILARDQIGVLALPAETGFFGNRLFHHCRGVDEHFHLAASIFNQPARDLLEPRLDQLVIVVALGVDRDGGAVLARQDRQRVLVRPVIHAQHDHRAHVWPQRAGRGAALGRCRHPHHVAVGAVGEKTLQPRLGFRHGVGLGDAGHVEAACPRVFDERALDRFRLDQKSRSA